MTTVNDVAVTVVMEVSDWKATPGCLALQWGIPVLKYATGWSCRHVNWNPGEDRSTWGWYYNDSSGAKLDDDNAFVLDALVLNHPVLKTMADQYGIG